MMETKCIIVDDEPIARSILKDYISRDERLQLTGSFKSAAEALLHIHNQPTDLIFLDIKMPGISGIEFLKSLKTPPIIIFTTAFREYATDGFDLNAIDYLVKPFSSDRFLQAINKVAEALKHSSKEVETERKDFATSIFVKDGTKLIQIGIDDILYVEALREYIKIVTRTKKYLVHQSMKSVEEKLPSHNFIRIHKSYIAAINKIHSIEGNMIVIGEHMLPISRQLKEEIIDRITKNRTI
ncbi:LytR/AlgR family response regulator transcription factor [Segetibacter aerophilus]|uniref:DNA-binding response regulator n=1 Tax=Segetibacter aerophilus TaxID=670293 RepID=A0A512B6Z9_9BACT|nr:LytTR family DNA-binding domain-containing protein [Segetibacter aerophilus]GEO07735.1 DNA-binding response regulator [Segetibacter aerophilus]